MISHFYNALLDEYYLHTIASFRGLRVNYAQLTKQLAELNTKPIIEIAQIGKSSEGRILKSFRIGKGKKKLLFFSQMHGNESTGTRAIVDILNFFVRKGNFETVKRDILSQLTICFIPMLNPDGAERFIRQNAFYTDINRDADALHTTEGQALMHYIDREKPDKVYSLHDQPGHYAVADSLLPVAFSFLAPAFDVAKSTNHKRMQSMESIVFMADMLQEHFPKQTAKYSDDYMPNAFGDKIAEKGYISVLVETGHIPGDDDKELLRQYQFAFLLADIWRQAKKQSLPNAVKLYEQLPYMKKECYFYYLLRNIRLEQFGTAQSADLGIERKCERSGDSFVIKEIGDLSRKRGFYETDAGSFRQKKSVAVGDDATDLVSIFFHKE